jgi:hypothetical protein
MSEANETCELTESQLDDIRALARSNLFFFAKAILGFDKLSPGLHGWMCNALAVSEHSRRFLFLLPRDHFKTTLFTISLPIHILIQREEDNIYFPGMPGCDTRILITNETSDNAKRFLRKIKRIFESNALFQALFPEVIPDFARTEKWSASEILIPRQNDFPEASIETAGVGVAVTSRHYDVIIADDLISVEAANSNAVMEDAVEYYRSLESLMVDSLRGLRVTVGTRWAPEDLYSRIMETEPDVAIFVRSAIENGAPIFPEQFSLEKLEQIRQRVGSYLFALNYMNDPQDLDVSDFREGWVKRFTLSDDEKTIVETGVKLAELDKVAVLDPASEKARGEGRNSGKSNPAFVVMGQDHKHRVYVLHAYAKRDTIQALCAHIFNTWPKYKPRVLGIESVALQSIFGEYIRREARSRKLTLPIVSVTPHTHRTKEWRIRSALQPIAENGRLYVHKSLIQFMLEYNKFPSSGSSDLLDAAAYGVRLLRRPHGGVDDEEQIRADRQLSRYLRNIHAVAGY